MEEKIIWMDWNRMEDKIKTIGIYYPKSSNSSDKIPLLDFNIENFMNQGYLLEENSLKFMQVYINKEHYLRIGSFWHMFIFKSLLSEFNIEFDTMSSRTGHPVPSIKGKNNDYELVGAGRVKPENKNFIFYDFSSDYIDYIKGADGKNLEDIFGKDNVKEREGEHREPSFLIEFNGE